ncbi:DNA integrity scanning diadenylate cyclase DisA [Nonomuraea cavernae]|uniref:DNA integrity scanning protein DisA n=1 Tax=Nonomuraea cavernae TaxID=2045107 RepID=A0A917YQS3_9ACTN|nr:DNA integrity scanning diadenylate cyclase DisA [Nonomuraea cavernae]MCA2183846.1 DNA integrity scanning diadenylate cyclase DisA [Nonomuraea cavernae]GGO61546.1 DNA integrity scanning protein DisA [Nonomuraea cavernae]
MANDRSLDDRRRIALASVAPGTPLRDGLERILRGQTGGLIVLGYNSVVEQVCSGGFELEVDFSATRLRELAKMDGAIVVNGEHKIIRAAVHLVPDPAIPTDESGTRHRTAQRVARQTGLPIIAISKSMRIIALYLDGIRYVLEESAAILSKANQALATLERYKHRLDEVSGTLSALEIEDLVTVRDVAAVAQRLEMVRRINDEIKGYVVELGTDGRLLSLQLDELVAGVDSERELVVRDYLPSPTGRRTRRFAEAMHDLDQLSGSELLDLSAVAHVLGHDDGETLDSAVSPRGFRLLAKVPRLPATVVDRLVNHFGGLQKLLAASIDDLQAVGGVGESRARSVREGLSRLAESSILERYV